MAHQIIEDQISVLLWRMRHRIQGDLRMFRRLVGIIDASKVFDLSTARHGIHPFDIALYTYFQWRIHENLDESIGAHHIAHIVACRPVGTHRCTHDYTPVAHDLGCHVTDAPDVDIAILLT